jgi:hypothetical protein
VNYVIKTMSLGEILDQAFSLLKNHFKMLLTISLYMMVPLQIVQQVVLLTMMPTVSVAPGAPPAAAIAALLAVLPFLIVQIICSLVILLVAWPITEAAVLRAIASEYLDKHTTPIECLRESFKKFSALLTTHLLSGLIVIVGFICFIVPGIYFIYKYFFAIHAVMIEDKSGSAALSRSGELMKGNFGNAFTISLVLFVISFVAATVSNFVPNIYAQVVLQVGINAVLFTLSIAASVVFYFSCRCNLENFDLSILANAVQGDAVPATAPVVEGSTLPQ